jgi:hypothetical protein
MCTIFTFTIPEYKILFKMGLFSRIYNYLGTGILGTHITALGINC